MGTQSILESLGVKILEEKERLMEILEEEGLVFLPTARLVPDFARLRPYREAFGLKPFANHIEKIFNLTRATTQMDGIYHRPYLEMTAEALAELGTPRIFIIQGVKGFTEFYLSRKTLVFRIIEGKKESFWLDPAEFGFQEEEEANSFQKSGDHARRIQELLEGALAPARQSILWNAGAKLFWMEKAATIEEGIHLVPDPS